jgi:hypothetical protein
MSGFVGDLGLSMVCNEVVRNMEVGEMMFGRGRLFVEKKVL